MAAGGRARRGADAPRVVMAARPRIDPRDSLYGRWIRRDGLPAFVYDLDQDAEPAAEWNPFLSPPTRRNWLMVGNGTIRLQGANDGTVALFDEGDGLRWLVAPEPKGTGVSIWTTVARLGQRLRSARRRAGRRAVRSAPRGSRSRTRAKGSRSSAPSSVRKATCRGCSCACSSGSRGAAARGRSRTSSSGGSPRFLNTLESAALRTSRGDGAVSYDVQATANGLAAVERFDGPTAQFTIGPPATLVLERLAGTPGDATHRLDGGPHPVLEITTSLRLRPGERKELWFRFGRPDAPPDAKPRTIVARSRRALADWVPTATAERAPEAAQEIPWHAALLRGGLAPDRVLGDRSLDQASTYSYLIGFNGAARDPLQHALPLVYVDPDAALAVLRNTCAWAQANGDLPYALDGAKRPDESDLPAVGPEPVDALARRRVRRRDGRSRGVRRAGRVQRRGGDARGPAPRAPPPAVPLLRRRRRARRAEPRAHPQRRLERRRDLGLGACRPTR
jgi:hypothetical protein